MSTTTAHIQEQIPQKNRNNCELKFFFLTFGCQHNLDSVQIHVQIAFLWEPSMLNKGYKQTKLMLRKIILNQTVINTKRILVSGYHKRRDK